MQRGGEGEGGMEVCWMVVDSLLDFSAVVHANPQWVMLFAPNHP